MKIDESRDFVLRVDKPVGPTSHDVVARSRRALHIHRVGHTGTLDPFASGLLLLCVNRATRLAEFLTGLDKTYVGVARLDGVTTTDDRTGEFIAQNDAWRRLDPARIEGAMQAMRGEVLQVPPVYSAKKVQGERAYRRARRGDIVQPSPVRVRIERFELLDLSLPELRFVVECSSGTYVRALARDLGQAMGTGGFLSELRRTRIGNLSVVDALSLAELDDGAACERAALSPLQALAHLPTLELDEHNARRFGQGQRLPQATSKPRDVIAVTHQDTLFALAREDGHWLWPIKVLSPS